MKNNNIGAAKILLAKKLGESYINGKSLVSESENSLTEFIDTIRGSEILQLEFKVFDNIEKKHIENELFATRYIDNNIKLFEVYTLEELASEHEKLKPFITEELSDSQKLNLYEAINTLIIESLSNNTECNTDDALNAFTFVLNHIKENRVIPTTKPDIISEEILEMAVDKFNEQYEALTDVDKELLSKLIKATPTEKIDMFETYKAENIENLNKLNNGSIEEKVTKTVQKLNEMKADLNTINDDIINLHELKISLL